MGPDATDQLRDLRRAVVRLFRTRRRWARFPALSGQDQDQDQAQVTNELLQEDDGEMASRFVIAVTQTSLSRLPAQRDCP